MHRGDLFPIILIQPALWDDVGRVTVIRKWHGVFELVVVALLI
jgi:hypothetical protein